MHGKQGLKCESRECMPDMPCASSLVGWGWGGGGGHGRPPCGGRRTVMSTRESRVRLRTPKQQQSAPPPWQQRGAGLFSEHCVYCTVRCCAAAKPAPPVPSLTHFSSHSRTSRSSWGQLLCPMPVYLHGRRAQKEASGLVRQGSVAGRQEQSPACLHHNTAARPPVRLPGALGSEGRSHAELRRYS